MIVLIINLSTLVHLLVSLLPSSRDTESVFGLLSVRSFVLPISMWADIISYHRKATKAAEIEGEKKNKQERYRQKGIDRKLGQQTEREISLSVLDLMVCHD